MANQLIADRARTILIVDNSPDLHHQLTKTCSEPQSTVSLLTFEYDVRDDLPEETSVFRLERASEEIMEKLIRKRFRISAKSMRGQSRAFPEEIGSPSLLPTLWMWVKRCRVFAARSYSQDSFGNAMEPARACLIPQKHAHLFIHSKAQTFALTTQNSNSSHLVGKSGPELHRDVAELRRRDLIQSRSVWRAVLPHAIANRLARRALESIPKDILVRGFFNSGSDRLIRSFTHRLSYLHDCETASEIVNDWLKQDGWIEDQSATLTIWASTF